MIVELQPVASFGLQSFQGERMRSLRCTSSAECIQYAALFLRVSKSQNRYSIHAALVPTLKKQRGLLFPE